MLEKKYYRSNCGAEVEDYYSACPKCEARFGAPNPGIAVVLSFLFMGFGQLYNQQIGKAIIFFVCPIISFKLFEVTDGFIFIPLLILWIYGFCDAGITAGKINAGEISIIIAHIISKDVNVSISRFSPIDLQLEEIKAMQPFEFQSWVCQRMKGRASIKKSGDMGIDGRLKDGRPLQVKKSKSVGRNVVDNFETATRRANKDKGIIVAFSFTKGAYEEVARARLHDGLDIELKTVEEILREYT